MLITADTSLAQRLPVAVTDLAPCSLFPNELRARGRSNGKLCINQRFKQTGNFLINICMTQINVYFLSSRALVTGIHTTQPFLL